MEKEKEPGTARFGNFINYYSFNPPEKRLSLLPASFLDSLSLSSSGPLQLLDVGSNAGDLTISAYERFTGLGPVKMQSEDSDKTSDTPGEPHVARSVHILGVDLDTDLITRSNKANPYPDQLTFRIADLATPAGRSDIVDRYLQEEACTPCFDLIMCFSVTLWVHLNHGDEGLREVLQYMASRTKYLLIEPQPWRCYRTAARRMRRAKCEPFAHLDSLKWRDAVDEEILNYLTGSCDMELVERYGRTDWDRSVCLLRNKTLTSLEK